MAVSKRIASLFVIAAAVILIFGFEPAMAQCAMCKQSVASSEDAAAAARGLNIAVLVLLAPPVLIFGAIFGLFYKHRNVQGKQFDEVIND